MFEGIVYIAGLVFMVVTWMVIWGKISHVEFNEMVAPCNSCKCLGYRNDFKKVEVKDKKSWLYDWETHLYFCKKCQPEYDIIIESGFNKRRYFKTVEAKQVEVKAKE